ncbi:MAG: lipopolysaccharide biosynthesis protein [Rikenellaceae bacterium]
MTSTKKKAVSNVVWSAIERFSVQGIQYIISIIIARILSPSDYGLIAMIGVFIVVFQTFIDGGFGNALIQKKNRTEIDYSTVFFFNIVVAFALYFLLCLSAPYIAAFYNEPKLDIITRVIGLILIINSFGIVQQAKLTIALDFKRQAVAALIAVTISGFIGIIMAYHGYGVWALVWHTLLNNLLKVVLLSLFTKWRPMAVFSIESFKGLFSFGSKILLSSLLHTIYTNLYTLVIGKKFASTDLGYFNRASTLAQFPSTNFTNVIVRAIYPIQCKMQDDKQQLNSMFLVYLRMACYIIFPIMIGLCVLAEPLIKLLLTNKWLPAVPFFQILCIAYMWDPIMKMNHNILNVNGRSDFFLQAEVVKKIIAIIILLTTIPFGIMVMCIGLVAYAFADMIIIIHYTEKLTEITLLKQTKELLPIILLSFSMGAVIYLSTFITTHTSLKLVIGSIVGAMYYFAGSHFLHFKELSQLTSLITKNKQ